MPNTIATIKVSFVGLILLAVAVLILPIAQTAAWDISMQSELNAVFAALPGVIQHEHAVIRHGTDAEAIRDTLCKTGAYQTWRTKDNKYFNICQLPDGRWGFQIMVQDAARKWHEVTAFVKGNGSWSELVSYLIRNGAAKWTGVIK